MYHFEVDSFQKYTFETDKRYLYEVVFSKLDFIFQSNDQIKDHIYELSVEIVSNFDKLPAKNTKTAATIAQIIEHYFRNHPSSFAVFHILNTDKKGSSRNTIFSNWFKRYNSDFLEKHDKIIKDDIDIFYVSLILRKDNPLKNSVLLYFSDWINRTNASK